MAGLQEGLEQVRTGRWSAVVLSLDLPAVDMALISRLVESVLDPTSLVLIAAQPTMQTVVEVSRLGILGLFSAPLDPAELETALREVFAAEEVVPLPAVEIGGTDGETVIGGSPAMLEVFRMVGRVAPSAATVLLLGESGTGKELVARAIHRNSLRAGGSFVAVNCAAIPENLLESELFGHEKGAFTGAIARKVGRFERADGGTLFLDELGDMSLALQSKILRAIQEREIERVGGEARIPVDVRLVAATHRDLRAAIAEGSFREDLYFRLAVVTLHLPRLVERGADLELLVGHYVARFAAQYGRLIRGIAHSAMEILMQHDWPGNVRELRNVAERAVLLSRGPVLLPEHLPLDQLGRTPPPGEGPGGDAAGYPPTLSLAEVERRHIAAVLRSVDGHMGQAAEVLGLHRNTLTRKVRELELDSDPV